MARLRGVFISAATPFTSDDEVNAEAAKPLIDDLIEAGAHGLVMLGDTGEFSSLTPRERQRYVETALHYVDGRVPAIVHASATTAREAIAYAKHAQEFGADAIMVLPPYYQNKVPGEDEVYAHYDAIAQAVDLPIVCYVIDQTGREVMTPQFIARLGDIDTFSYVKQSTGDLPRIREIKALCGEKVSVFEGEDAIMYDSFVAGADGAVWGGANIMPRECVQLFELIREKGDLKQARELWDRIFPICSFIVRAGYHACIKAALGLRDLDVGAPRRPTPSLTSQKKAEAARLLRENLGHDVAAV